MTATERQDWTRYRSTGDVSARNRLVERHLALVHHFARRMQRQVGGVVEDGDLVSAGAVGLLHAVAAFDPERGYRFSTFAASRIRGAMLDEMRRGDRAPRSVRKRQREMERERERLAVALNRIPTHGELAGALSVDLSTLWRWQRDVEQAEVEFLDERRSERWLAAGRRTGGEPSLEAVADRALEKRQELARLRRELDALPERDRLILRLYDLESLTLREIAARLGVTESRVSQLRTRALRRLRDRMRELRDAA